MWGATVGRREGALADAVGLGITLIETAEITAPAAVSAQVAPTVADPVAYAHPRRSGVRS